MQIRSPPFWLMIVSIAIDGLARRAVADDQLALAAADRRHRVDRLDAGLHGHVDALALRHVRRDALDRARLRRVDRPLAVERVAERVDDAPDERVADGHLRDAAGRADFVAFLDVAVVARG